MIAVIAAAHDRGKLPRSLRVRGKSLSRSNVEKNVCLDDKELQNDMRGIGPITQAMLRTEIDDLASQVIQWKGHLVYFKTLQEAPANEGHVHLMKSQDGESFAVKQMPMSWVGKQSSDFKKMHPESKENPWMDLAIIKLLNKRSFRYSCTFEGIFRDSENMYVLTGLANQGDLFAWCTVSTLAGTAREDFISPIVVQVFEAVRYLHEFGIAHRDLSLENMLLHEDEEGNQLVKIIDFGMATLKRYVVGEKMGKESYMAPEVHLSNVEYDGFLVDTFALGVCLYGLNFKKYPWRSTKDANCKSWTCYITTGMRNFLSWKIAKGAIGEMVSSALVEMLEGLLQFNPQNRWCLGEACWNPNFEHDRESITTHQLPIELGPHCTEERRSVWNCIWMRRHAEFRKSVSRLESQVRTGFEVQDEVYFQI